jgi:hypothetical protein
MKKVNLIKEYKYLIECPYCKDYKHDVSHMIDQNTGFGPWYCKSCKRAIIFKVKNGEFFIEETDKTSDKALVALELPPLENSLFLIVNGIYLDGDLNQEHKRYFYEEHTCPTNFLNDAREIIYNMQPDVHGLFRFLKAISYPDVSEIELCNYSTDDWESLFGFNKTLV